MEENKLFQEIEPLIEEYINYSRQEMPTIAFDLRRFVTMDTLDKQYPDDKEGELLRRLDEDRAVDVRIALIEELKLVREENMKAKREVIYSKVKEFVNNSIEQMNKEIEEKREQEIEGKIKKEIEEKTKELEEAEQKRKQSFSARMKAYKVRKMLLKEVGNESKIYKVADEEAKEKLEKNKEDVKRSKILKQELQEKNIELQEKEQEILGMEQDLQYFKDKYDDIEFLSEHGIYTLLDMIGLEKEQEMVRMSDGKVFDGQEEVSDMGTIMDMQEEAKKTEIPESISVDDIIEVELKIKEKIEKIFEQKYLKNKYPDINFEKQDIISRIKNNALFSELYARTEDESIGITTQFSQGEQEEAQKRFEYFQKIDEAVIYELLKDIFKQKQEIVKIEGYPISNESIMVLKQMHVTLEDIGITDIDADYLIQLDELKVEELSNNMQSIKREKIDELLLFYAKNYCGKDIPRDELALIYGEVRDNELFNEAYLEILKQAELVNDKFIFGYNQFLDDEIENFKNIDIMEMLKVILEIDKAFVKGLGDKATEDDIVKVMRMEETLKKIQKTLNPKKEKGQGTKTVTRTISQNIGQSGNGKKGIKPNEQGQQPIKPNIKIQNIVVDLKNKAVEIKIDGIEVPFVLENLNIEEVMQKGEHVKVQFLDEATFSEKSYIKKSDALILGALKEFGDRLKDAKMDEHKDIYENIDVLNANYMKNFTSSVRNTDSIKYILDDDKDNYSKKTFKQIKKSAKNAQNLGIAQIEGLKEMSIKDRIINWFAQRKTKRIESKTENKQPQQVLTKKQERERFIMCMNESNDMDVKRVVYKKGPKVKSIHKSQGREV